VEGLLAGRPSGESQRSFEKWLAKRSATRANTRLQPTARAGAPRLTRFFVSQAPSRDPSFVTPPFAFRRQLSLPASFCSMVLPHGRTGLISCG